MIVRGDDNGHLALYWINRWIKNPSVTLDEDLYEKGIEKRVATDAHPDNFAWRFNNSGELGKDTYAYYAIKTVYLMAGGRKF